MESLFSACTSEESRITTFEKNTAVYCYSEVSAVPTYIIQNCICCTLSIPKQFRIHECFQKLLDSITFDHCFAQSQRSTAFFGVTTYSYSGIKHRPAAISSNVVLTELCNVVNKLLPNFKFNSVLLNYYPNSHSKIPCHADDEADILHDSFILTLSLGDTRNMSFFNYSNTKLAKVELHPWDILIFSKISQFKYKHAVGAGLELFRSPRLSLTFRNLDF